MNWREHKDELLLVGISVALFLLFSKPFVMDWDGFDYINNIYEGHRSGLLLGRLGFIYFFIPLWQLLNVLGMHILDFHHVMRLFNIVFMIGSVVLVYLLAKHLFNRRIGLASALFFLFSRDVLGSGTDIITEPMMLFLLLASYYTFMLAHKGKNTLLVSGILFGWSFAVREAALFGILFFPAYVLYAGKLPYWEYVKAALLAGCVIMLGPLLVYLAEGNAYLENIAATSGHNVWTFSFARITETLTILQEGFMLLPLAAVGLVALLWQREKHGWVIMALLTPTIVFTFYGILNERFFLSSYVLLAILVAILVDRIRSKRAFVGVVVLLLTIQGVFFVGDLWEQRQESIEMQEYGAALLKYPDNAVFLIGKRSALLGMYYAPLTGMEREVIWSGWDWPGDDLDSIVGQHLQNGKPVIVDARWYTDEAEIEDIQRILAMYNVTVIG